MGKIIHSGVSKAAGSPRPWSTLAQHKPQ